MIPTRGKRKECSLMEVLWNPLPQPSPLFLPTTPFFAFFLSPLSMSIYQSSSFHQFICPSILHHFSGSYSYFQGVSIKSIYISSWSYIHMATHLSGWTVKIWIWPILIYELLRLHYVPLRPLTENGTLDLS